MSHADLFFASVGVLILIYTFGVCFIILFRLYREQASDNQDYYKNE